MFKPEKVNLGNVCSGAAAEVFEREMARVLENIADPNTDPEAVRGITIQFKFAPNAKRNKVAIAYVVKSAIAPIKTESANAFIAMEAGELGLYSMDVNQGSLPLDQPLPPVVEEIRPLSAGAQKTTKNTMQSAPAPSAN